MGKKLKGWWPVWWMIAVWFVSFTPLLFFRRWIHWDLVQYTLPQLVFQSDFFRAGQMPLWDPFQECGLPVFSNPGSLGWFKNQRKSSLWMTGIALLLMLFGGMPASNLMGLLFFAIFVILRLGALVWKGKKRLRPQPGT